MRAPQSGPDQAEVDRWVRHVWWFSLVSIPLQMTGVAIFIAFVRSCEVPPNAVAGLGVHLLGRLSAAFAVGRCVRLWRAGVTLPRAGAALAIVSTLA